MITFAETPWPSEIDAAINRAATYRADRAFFADTVSLIEAGKNPSGTGRLTVTALKAWEAACRTTPTHEDTPVHASSSPRVLRPKNRAVQNTAP